MIKRKQHITIPQANVGKGSIAHETILNVAFNAEADFLLVQELRIKAAQKRETVTHHRFQCFAPETDWTVDPPSVLTYIRRGRGLYCVQDNLSVISPNDILVIRIGHKYVEDITLINIYNAPAGTISPGTAT